MNCRYYTERTLGWMLNNKLIVFLSLLSFCLFVSTLALSGQKGRLTDELNEARAALTSTTTTLAPAPEENPDNGGETDNGGDGGNTDTDGQPEEGGNTDGEGGNTDTDGQQPEEGGNTDGEDGNTDTDGQQPEEGGNTDGEGGNTDTGGQETDNGGSDGTSNENGGTVQAKTVATDVVEDGVEDAETKSASLEDIIRSSPLLQLIQA